MIKARLQGSRSLVLSLTDKAAKLAAAHAEQQLRARRADPWRWRRAELLWPLFTRER